MAGLQLVSVLSVLALVVRTAGADDVRPLRNSLRWIRPAGSEACISGDDLQLLVEQRLGRRVFSASADAELFIEGRVVRVTTPSGWQATIRVSGADGGALGERELGERGDDCRLLDAKLALVIALIIDPDAMASAGGLGAPPPAAPPADPPAAPPVDPPAPSVDPPAPTVDPVAPPKRSRAAWRGSVATSALLSAGLLPGGALGFGLAVELTPPWFWPIEVSGQRWLEDRETEGAGGSTFSLLVGGLGLCPRLGGRFTPALCVGLRAGRLAAQGFGFAENHAATLPLVHATLDARVTLRLAGRLFVRGSVAGWLALSRPRFTVTREPAGDEVLVYQPSAASVLAELGLGLSF